MTDVIRRHRWKLTALAAVATIAWIVAAGLRAGNAWDDEPVEAKLVMRGVAFYAAGQAGPPNPVLELERGRPVRLTVENQEPGAVLHCFSAPGLGVKSKGSLAAGESETIALFPRDRGTFTYACLLHPGMAGKIVVR
jgi:FtsP/CotA-like multicopper oxidase with cupredoxin domain